MRREPPHASEQRSLCFARDDIWESLPTAVREKCLELCEQMLRAVLHIPPYGNQEVSDEREDSTHSS
jgi:hypothetical protein